MKPRNEIVIIAGGSFQGKSTVAISLAKKFNFSGILSTDMVRNILKISYPNEKYFSTSTYLLSKDDLTKQMDAVSKVIQKTIPIYQSRGEYIIFEGMHFSEWFLSWAANQSFVTICLDNKTSFAKRIVLKGNTRSKLKIQNNLFNTDSSDINNQNVNETIYMRYADVITNIHKSILKICSKHGFDIVEFQKIKKATNKCSKILTKRNSNS